MLSPSYSHDHLANFFTRASNLIFSRFLLVFDMNLESISGKPKDLGPIDIRPHYVTRRYAEFVASINTLYGPLPDSFRDTLTVNMSKLRVIMGTLLLRMSDALKDAKDRPIFLINNYDLILSIVNERVGSAEEVAYFSGLQKQCIQQFVNDQLKQFNYYSTMMAFVHDIGPLVDAASNRDANGNAPYDEIVHPKFNPDVVETILKEFAYHWRSGIGSINGTVTKLFPNFKTGMALFQIVLETILSYYKQFSTIIVKCFKQLRSSKTFISETEIVHEMRKYTVTFD